jgi:HlyD family secretion protein
VSNCNGHCLMKRLPLIIAIIMLAAAAGTAWWLLGGKRTQRQLVLYGDVDLRQVDLAFNDSGRIAAVDVQEGDRVQRGEILARLDTSRLEPQVEEAEATAAAQREVVARMHHGSRPQEIAEARANVTSAEADAVNARGQYLRLKTLAANAVVSQQSLDNAKAALDVAEAKLAVNQKALDLAVAGPRQEDIAQAEAELRADEAQAAFLRAQLADTTLVAPSEAVVRTRLMEPGEMASPQKPVFSLAVINPKWVRAYVAEPDLGKLRMGMPASIAIDSFPDQHFRGWVGFVSPVAEFTPKNVETEELRTSLVYEVRVFVKDPSDQLHLGSPATVSIAINGVAHGSPPAASFAAVARAQP